MFAMGVYHARCVLNIHGRTLFGKTAVLAKPTGTESREYTRIMLVNSTPNMCRNLNLIRYC